MAAIVEARSLSRGFLDLFGGKHKASFLSKQVQLIRNNHTDCSNHESYDIVIAGGGMVGSSLACALANNRRLQSKRILLLERGDKFNYVPQEQYSNRVVALNKQSRVLLSSIGAWKHIEAGRFTTVRKMQIWDACSDAMITFNEDQLESSELAYIVENNLILHAVDKVLSEKNSVKVINNAKVEDIVLPDKPGVEPIIRLQTGESFTAKLLVGADGQKSMVRQAMNVRYIDWDYDQMAIVATVRLSEPTENIVAWQRFLSSGPVALLPLTDSLSSIVWSMPIAEAKKLLGAPEEEFVDSLNDALWKKYPQNSLVEGGMKALQQLLETLQLQTGVSRQLQPSICSIIEGSRAAFPLGFGHAVQYVQPSVALIGDAAHRVHPLAGQGVNLGFGDTTAMVTVLSEAVSNGALLGDVTYLHKYESMRQWHNIPTMLTIDALHRLYKGTAPPIVLARSLGLQLTNAIKPLKKLLIEHAADQRTLQRGQ